jgi:hypothetical protein
MVRAIFIKVEAMISKVVGIAKRSGFIYVFNPLTVVPAASDPSLAFFMHPVLVK